MTLPFVPTDSGNEKQHRTVLATTINELVKFRPPHDQTESEVASGITIYDPRYPPGDVRRYGVDPSRSDVTVPLQAAANAIPTLFFPPGTYRISSTIQRKPFSRWVGEFPQSNENGSGAVTPEVVIFGTVANIGDGNPLVRLCEANVAGSSYVTEYISFQSDLSVDTEDLEATSSTGVVGVNIDHAKNGTEFIGCSFRNLKHAIQQVDTDPYSDKVTLTRCHITRCYLAIDADPTAGLSLVDTFVYDCRDYIQSTTDVSCINCSFNNSSIASDTCGIKASLIVFIGGWIEGGNKFFQPTLGLYVASPKVSEMQSSGTKFLIYPQNEDVTIHLKNHRVPTNTRLFDLGLISDYSALHITAEGLNDGTNFANVASIQTYLDAGLDFRGWGNLNSDLWNVSNQIRNVQNAAYTFTRNDHDHLIYHSSAVAHTWTIDSNANLALPLNTTFHLVNDGSGAVTLAITSDTLEWAGSTGSFTLRQNESVTVRKVASTTWRVVGGKARDLEPTNGTYSPTLTGVANVDATTTFTAQYYRIGNVVTVSGKMNVDPTVVTTLTQVGISLPVASNFANEQDCAGTAAATGVAESGAINADTTNDRAQLNFISAGTANHTVMYQFTYRVS